jgi:hypothetical protein
MVLLNTLLRLKNTIKIKLFNLLTNIRNNLKNLFQVTLLLTNLNTPVQITLTLDQ